MPWSEPGFLLRSISFALRSMHSVTRDIAARSSLGLRGAKDGRRTQLALTPLGADTRRHVRDQLRALVAERLGGYSRNLLMSYARVQSDFREPRGT